MLTPESALRIATLGGLLVAALGILLVRLWFLQVISEERYAARADANRLRTVLREAPRGAIVDRDGRPLVTNRTGTSVVARPRWFADGDRAEVIRRLARVLRVSPESLDRTIDDATGSPFESVVVAGDIDAPTRLYLAERRRDFPGIDLRATYTRAYPAGSSLAHVIGYTGPITAETIADYRARGYRGDETVGASGLEAQYERYLAGAPGEMVIEVDASGEPRSRQVVSAIPPRQGLTLQLAIDLPTQAALADAIAERVAESGSPAGGAGVALDPASGEILAIASYPSYSPDALLVPGPGRWIVC